MPQISFTPRNSDVYDRFSKLMLQYQLDHKCKLTAPEMLDILIEAFEALEAQSYASPLLRQSGAPQFTTLMVDNFLKQHFPIEPEVEANERVIIKQSDGALYLEKMLAHNHNAHLTPHKDDAMVFDSHNQAKAFLRKCGHEVGNWIIEPVNESK